MRHTVKQANLATGDTSGPCPLVRRRALVANGRNADNKGDKDHKADHTAQDDPESLWKQDSGQYSVCGGYQWQSDMYMYVEVIDYCNIYNAS